LINENRMRLINESNQGGIRDGPQVTTSFHYTNTIIHILECTPDECSAVSGGTKILIRGGNYRIVMAYRVQIH
jgi:hypothetical protein